MKCNEIHVYFVFSFLPVLMKDHTLATIVVLTQELQMERLIEKVIVSKLPSNLRCEKITSNIKDVKFSGSAHRQFSEI